MSDYLVAPGAVEFFRKQFVELTDLAAGPYRWQQDLFQELILGNYPSPVCLPTGLGKTSVMTVWLLALAWQAREDAWKRTVPVRLVWVVNRRVVVDQATKEAEKLSERTRTGTLSDVLRELSGAANGPALSVSTLRGELADNREWSENPARPAIIIGTVDMVGSRLLFSGYGDGAWWRPQHAGLLGQDALIVNDESHLTPPFAKLLKAVHEQQEEDRGASKRLRHLQLSATPRGGGAYWPGNVEGDLACEGFRRIFEAPKRLTMHEVRGVKEIEPQIIRLATEHEAGDRRLVFVRQPKTALRVADEIRKRTGTNRVTVLTGTMRGWERDQLVKSDEVFKEFQDKSAVPRERCWLVATSAGEVGVDITSDLLVTDLETADHLIQRFGRLNRFGGPGGFAHLVHAKAADREAATLMYLQGLPKVDGGFDISGRSLYEKPAPDTAVSEEAAQAFLSRRLVDLWSQTSRDRKRAWRLGSRVVPDVEWWLHGKEPEGRPQTSIAWRQDVEWLTSWGVRQEELELAVAKHRVLAHEIATEPTEEARKKLEGLAAEFEKRGKPARVVCIGAGGGVEALDLVYAAKEWNLEYATVILPVSCWSLASAMFGDKLIEPAADSDVADRETERFRYRIEGMAGEWKATRIAEKGAEAAGGKAADVDDVVQQLAKANGWKEVARVAIRADPESDAEPDLYVSYLKKLPEPTPRGEPELLSDHQRAVARAAGRFAERLGLPGDVQEALRLAGELHDVGKAEPVWQKAAGNRNDQPIAKPRRYFAPAELAGFRHEFASLLKAVKPESAPPEVWDLALHLIASHHARSRPFFAPRAFDRRDISASERLARECAIRFGHLQQRWGPWGLAYLEAIFKAADAMVSAAAEAGVEQSDGG